MKYLMTSHPTPGNSKAIDRLSLPSFDWGLNCLHGVQSTCPGTSCPTSFPNPVSFGATFNMTNARAMGAIMGRELRALWSLGAQEEGSFGGGGVAGLDCWSPNININRDPVNSLLVIKLKEF
jgi:beta-glucosidase-like glycosyl hydrolase